MKAQYSNLVALFVVVGITHDICGQPPLVTVQHQSPVRSLAWFPDGKELATGTDEGTIHVIDARSGKKVRNISANQTYYPSVVLPNGETVTMSVTLTRGPVAALAISGDAKNLAFLEKSQNGGLPAVGLVDIPGEILLTRSIDLGQPKFIHRSKENVLLFSVGPHVAFTVNVSQSHAAVKVLDPKHSGLVGCAPDGSAYGWSDQAGVFTMWIDHKARKVGPGIQLGKPRCLAFGPEAKLLAVASHDEPGVQLWDLPRQQKILMLTGLESPPAQLSFSADGKSLAALATNGATVAVWDVTEAQPRRLIRHHQGVFAAMALSPDGRMLATAERGGKELRLWRVGGRKLGQPAAKLVLSDEDLSTLWADLASADDETAMGAWNKLGAAGDGPIPFLAQKIKPLVSLAADRLKIDAHLAALDSDNFATRQRAMTELVAVGEAAILPVRLFVEKAPSLEAATRAKQLLVKLGQPPITPDRMRVLEVVELLEQLLTPKAIALLQEIKDQAQVSPIYFEASQALLRIERSKGK